MFFGDLTFYSKCAFLKPVAPTNRQLLIILILLVAVLGFGFLAKHTIAAFRELSVASLSMAGVETDASFNMAPARIIGLDSDVHNGKVVLSWRPIMKSKLNGYRVYRGKSADNQLIIGGSGQPTFTDEDVVSGEVYYYRVAAVNDLGEGYLSAPLRVEIE
jgi:fibronectin type 3 domain-containing protein